MAEAPYTEQPDFHYFECKECGFDSIQFADFNGTDQCPLCFRKEKVITMTRRVARSTDDPEGVDQRIGEV